MDTYGGEITAAQMALALREGESESESGGTTFDRLRNSIKTSKRIINPIVINKRDGKYVCVEGNTRVLIYRDFYKEEKAEHWRTIPCLIYTDAGLKEMDSIRLQAHLVGPRQWDPYSKARYLAKLWNKEYLSTAQIIEYCGGNKKQIQDSITAYKMVEDVYKPLLEHPEDFDHTRFSGFIEYQDSKVHRAVLDAGFDDKQFALWLHERKIERLEHVRRLPDILSNNEAKLAFLSNGSNEALKILNQPSLEELMQKHDIREILDAIRQKISRFGYEDIEEYKQQSGVLIPVIDEALESIQSFKSDIAE